MSNINTHGMICDFGKHQGERWTRIPVSYLKWVANHPTHTRGDIARAELERRGTTTPDLDLSGHAIDRASIQLNKKWLSDQKPDEGLNSWLLRVSGEALQTEAYEDGTYYHKGIKFVFTMDGTWPVLKTVMRANTKPKKNKVDSMVGGTTKPKDPNVELYSGDEPPWDD